MSGVDWPASEENDNDDECDDDEQQSSAPDTGDYRDPGHVECTGIRWWN